MFNIWNLHLKTYCCIRGRTADVGSHSWIVARSVTDISFEKQLSFLERTSGREREKSQQLKGERIPRFPLLGVSGVRDLSTCPVSIISLNLSESDYKTREGDFVKLQHLPGIPHFAKHVQIDFCKSLLHSQLIKPVWMGWCDTQEMKDVLLLPHDIRKFTPRSHTTLGGVCLAHGAFTQLAARDAAVADPLQKNKESNKG